MSFKYRKKVLLIVLHLFIILHIYADNDYADIMQIYRYADIMILKKNKIPEILQKYSLL